MSETRVPEPTQDEFEEITQEKLDKLKNGNQNRFTAIIREEPRARIDPATIFSVRFETFLDTFLNDRERLLFEYRFEQQMEKQLKGVLTEVRQQKILAGTQNVSPQGLVIPGK